MNTVSVGFREAGFSVIVVPHYTRDGHECDRSSMPPRVDGANVITVDLYAGEFAITPKDGAAFQLSGLSFPTKFNLRKTIELPYSTPWFDVPPAAPFGNSPQLGVLHPNLMRRASAGWQAAQSPPK